VKTVSFAGRIQGIIPPLATPFGPDGELDLDALRAEVRFALDCGVHGVTVASTTGEGMRLSDDEAIRVVEVTVREVGGRVPVIAGIMRTTTRDAVRLGTALRAVGADALQLTPPPADRAGIQAFHEAVAGQVGLPLVIFNMQARQQITSEWIERLAAIPEIVAVKQSNGDIHKLADLLLANQGRLRIVTALDDLLYPSFLLGADAAVTPLLAVVPDLAVQLWDACQRGDHRAARELHTRILVVTRAVHSADVLPAIKAAIELRGRRVGSPRHPALPSSPAVRAELAAALTQAGLSTEPASRPTPDRTPLLAGAGAGSNRSR
jgi:4-hydroxy-tetrahydrodipicolinate synthase